MASARRRSRFRPCIDLHHGQVKQIVGGTLSDNDPDGLKTNYVARFVVIALMLRFLTLISSAQ
jgi:phosphoribosylformimino-5-aminoimidazole carboxamide ribonucleotide (ProFAR) isomerase